MFIKATQRKSQNNNQDLTKQTQMAIARTHDFTENTKDDIQNAGFPRRGYERESNITVFY